MLKEIRNYNYSNKLQKKIKKNNSIEVNNKDFNPLIHFLEECYKKNEKNISDNNIMNNISTNSMSSSINNINQINSLKSYKKNSNYLFFEKKKLLRKIYEQKKKKKIN